MGRGQGGHRSVLVQGVHPCGVAVPDPAQSPLLAALPGEEAGKGFVQPLLGFLHSCGTKGIFLFLMTPLTIHVFPSRVLLPTLVTASSSICCTCLGLSWERFCSEKEKEGSRTGSKAQGTGSHGVFESVKVSVCALHSPGCSQGPCRAALGGRRC